MGEYTGVRYLGSVKIKKSLIEYQAVQRERVVAKAILKLFHETDLELTPQLNPNLQEIDRIPYEQIDTILGPVRVSDNPRTPSTVTMDQESVSITIPKHNSVGDGKMYESDQLIAQHQMDVISFASLDMSVYVSYVAKQSGDSNEPLESTRACHVIQCATVAQASEMYKAFEVAFNQHTKKPLKPFAVPDVFNSGKSGWDDTLKKQQQPEEHTYYNTSGKEPPRSGVVNLNAHKARGYVNDDFIKEQLMEKDKVDSNSNIIIASTAPTTPTNVVYVNDPLQLTECDERLVKLVTGAKRLTYYHDGVDRTTAERRLVNEGDFLIRESSLALIEGRLKNICLSVRNHHQFKHLVLIEKERSAESGRIHTRDLVFNSIAELLEYFQQDSRTLEMPGDIDQAIRISRAIPNSSYV